MATSTSISSFSNAFWWRLNDVDLFFFSSTFVFAIIIFKEICGNCKLKAAILASCRR